MAISDYMEDLIYRVLAGEVDEVERKEFETWLRENDEHRVFFEKIERAWYTGKYAARWKNVEMSAAWKAVEHGREQRQRRRFRRIGWGVAASVAVLVGITWIVGQREEGSLVSVVAQSSVVKPGEAKARLVLSSGVEVELGCVNGDIINEKGGPILNGKEYIDYSKQENTLQGDVVYNELIVPPGGEYRLVLADRTVVYMNSESRLKYPVMFGGKNRMVELEGEAYFEVRRDSSRPFIVHAGDQRVTVLGTSFGMTCYANEVNDYTTLVSGKVKVELQQGKQAFVLKPGTQVEYNKESGMVRERRVDVAEFVAWKEGKYVFKQKRLEDILSTLSRWYDFEVFYQNSEMKEVLFSGELRRFDDFNYLLQLIERTSDVKFIIDKKVVQVVR